LRELNTAYNKGFSSGFLIKAPTSDDFSKIEHSSSTQKKEFIGEIIHYFPKVGVAALRIMSGELRIGDEIIVIGDTTGIKRQKIERIEINNKSVNSAKKGQEVGIKIPVVRKGEKVYLVIKK